MFFKKSEKHKMQTLEVVSFFQTSHQSLKIFQGRCRALFFSLSGADTHGVHFDYRRGQWKLWKKHNWLKLVVRNVKAYTANVRYKATELWEIATQRNVCLFSMLYSSFSLIQHFILQIKILIAMLICQYGTSVSSVFVTVIIRIWLGQYVNFAICYFQCSNQ